MNFRAFIGAYKAGLSIRWNDPEPIEGNDYKVNEIIGLEKTMKDIEDFTDDELDDYILSITYGDGSEAEVFWNELVITEEFVHDEMFLNDDHDESKPCWVFFKDGIFYAINPEGVVRKFELLKKPEDLNIMERQRVLEYGLCSVPKDEDVYLSDIFLQGEFIKEIIVTAEEEIGHRIF